MESIFNSQLMAFCFLTFMFLFSFILKMKEGRRAGGITAGPESKVLDGPTWDEARQMQMEGKTVVDSGVDFRVGAASKGIIQRDFQHHATVFKSAYAKNPFDNISEDELAEYKRIIDAKARGDGNLNLAKYFGLFV